MSEMVHSREQGLSYTDGELITAHARSDRGMIRERNEDAFAMDPGLGLFLVSDGMGGHRGGREASALVAGTLPKKLKSAWPRSPAPSLPELEAVLQEAAVSTAESMRNKSRLNPLLNGMGATLVCALISGGKALIAHMGDSRAYLLRDSFFERLTKDHSVVELLVDLGRISQSQALSHPARHTLTRHAGMAGEAALECSVLPIKPGDRLLLCSDGLTNELADSEIAAVMAEAVEPDQSSNRLVNLARERGGRDNITVCILHCGPPIEEGPNRSAPVKVRKGTGFSLSKGAFGGKIEPSGRIEPE